MEALQNYHTEEPAEPVASTITSDEGATFEPWTDGHAIGFKVTAPGKPDRWVILNPSGGQDTGNIDHTNVFLYVLDGPDVAHDGGPYQSYVEIWPGGK